MESNVTV